MVSVKDRLPNMGERVLFLDNGYKGTYMAEYLPHEKIELKKGKFIEMMNCKTATDFLLGNYTHWLEKTVSNPFSREL